MIGVRTGQERGKNGERAGQERDKGGVGAGLGRYMVSDGGQCIQ